LRFKIENCVQIINENQIYKSVLSTVYCTQVEQWKIKQFRKLHFFHVMIPNPNFDRNSKDSLECLDIVCILFDVDTYMNKISSLLYNNIF